MPSPESSSKRLCPDPSASALRVLLPFLRHVVRLKRRSFKRAQLARATARSRLISRFQAWARLLLLRNRISAVRSARRARVRQYLARFHRGIRPLLHSFVSVTVQPFEFMLTSAHSGSVVTELRPSYHGHAYVTDPQGRIHQQMTEVTVDVPKACLLGLAQDEMIWLGGAPTRLRNALAHPLFQQPPVRELLELFQSPLSAIRIVDVIDLHPPTHYDPLQVVNYASARPEHLYHPHATAWTREGATTLEDWLQPGPAAPALGLASNACGYDIILHLYKAAIEALQRPDARRPDHKSGRFHDCVMTYQGLHTFIRGSETFDPTNLGLTLPAFRRFFVKMRLQLTVIDATGAPIPEACHVPSAQNRLLNPWHVRVVHRDNHLYLLNHGLNSLAQARNAMLSTPIPSEKLQVESGECIDAPTAHYHIRGAPDPVEFISRLDDLVGLDIKKAAGAASRLRVVCPMDPTVALRELLLRGNASPGLTFREGKILALKLRINGCDVSLSPPDSVPNDRTMMLHAKPQFELYRALEAQLYASVINCQTLSSYSDVVARTFRELPRAPLHYRTSHADPSMVDPVAAKASEVTGRALPPLTSEQDISK